MFDTAPAQIRTGNGVSNRPLFRDDANVLCSINKDFVSGQQLVALVQAWLEIVEEFSQLRNEAIGQVADLPAHARVRGGEARAG